MIPHDRRHGLFGSPEYGGQTNGFLNWLFLPPYAATNRLIDTTERKGLVLALLCVSVIWITLSAPPRLASPHALWAKRLLS